MASDGDWAGEAGPATPLDNIAGVTNPATSSGSSFWGGVSSFFGVLEKGAGIATNIIKATNQPSQTVASPVSQVRGVSQQAGSGADNSGIGAALGKFGPWVIGLAVVGLLVWGATKIFGKGRKG